MIGPFDKCYVFEDGIANHQKATNIQTSIKLTFISFSLKGKIDDLSKSLYSNLALLAFLL